MGILATPSYDSGATQSAALTGTVNIPSGTTGLLAFWWAQEFGTPGAPGTLVLGAATLTAADSNGDGSSPYVAVQALSAPPTGASVSFTINTGGSSRRGGFFLVCMDDFSSLGAINKAIAATTLSASPSTSQRYIAALGNRYYSSIGAPLTYSGAGTELAQIGFDDLRYLAVASVVGDGSSKAHTWTSNVESRGVIGALVNFSAAPAAPDAPTSLTRSGAVSMTWTLPGTGAARTAVRVERRNPATSGTYATLATLGASAVSYDDVSAANGVQYQYRVFAVNGAGDSAASNEIILDFTGGGGSGLGNLFGGDLLE